MPVLLIVLAMLALRGPLRPPPAGMKLLYEDETAYNLVQVVEDEDGYRYLLLNEGQGYPFAVASHRDFIMGAPGIFSWSGPILTRHPIRRIAWNESRLSG